MTKATRTMKRLAATARPYKVIRYGTDSSGRPIYMNQRMVAAFQAACDLLPAELAAKLVIVQGAYMARLGGGAAASAGYHDKGGCIDTRTWNLTEDERRLVIKAARAVGWAIWERGPSASRGGMDEHMHWVLLGDAKAASGAKFQMADYKAGFNGLSGTAHGPDYHPRPDPIPTFNYGKWLKEQQMNEDRIIKAVRDEAQRTRDVVNARAKGALERDQRIEARMTARTDAVKSLISDLPADKQTRILRELQELRAELTQEN